MPDIANESPKVTAGARADRPSDLSDQEMHLLHLIADGLTTKSIANRLNVNFKTAACRQSRLFQKLNTTSRFSAVRAAFHYGIIPG